MRDLDSWRRFVENRATAEDVLAVASLSLPRRVAYVSHILPLVTHADPSMRAAAMRALAGARGVEGVRAIVARLDDDDASVRTAALDALRETARDAPYRFVHALFHPRIEIRRAALAGDLPTRIAELAVYLRADRGVADLTPKTRWPDGSFGLALDFYRGGHLAARELVELFTHLAGGQVRALVTQAQARTADQLEIYFKQQSRDAAATPRGLDVLDWVVAAIAEAGAPARAIEQLVDIVTAAGQNRILPRRAAGALLAYLARSEGTAALWSACVALEPSVIGFPIFRPDLASAAAAGLFRFRWPIKPPQVEVEGLLQVEVVRHDLALAAAVSGLLLTKRLASLATALGDDAIVASLVARDHGWDEICRLPAEHPAVELVWLQRVEKADYKRYLALAGRMLGTLDDHRLDKLVEQLPRRHRPGAFRAAAFCYASASDERVASVARAIATRVDRATLSTLLQQLLAPASPDTEGRMVLAIARAVPAKLLGGAAVELDDGAVVRLIELAEADPLPRDRELALANALVPRALPLVIEWRTSVELTVAAPPVPAAPTVRIHRALTSAERAKISTCAEGALEAALEPVFAGHISGLASALGDRPAAPSLVACNALLGCADPIHDVARMLDRFCDNTPAFDVLLDNAAVRWVRVRDLPALAHARLWRWEAHSFAIVDWVEAIGSARDALLVVDALPGRLARHTLWKAISEAMMLLRYRALDRFAKHATLELAQHCAEHVDRDIGRHAARLLVALVESRLVSVAEIRDRMLDRIADADAEAREYLARLVRLEGIPQPPPALEQPSVPLLDQIRASTDLDALTAWCRDVRPVVVQEAALALVVLGVAGQARLAELLDELDAISQPVPLLATIVLWDHPPALDAVRALAAHPELPPAWQFHVSLALLARGETDALGRVIAAVRAPPRGWYFRRDDWDELVRVADVVTCAIALADAPHHHAYQRALHTLLSLTRPTEEVRAALLRFLDVGDARPLHLRVSVARYLAQHWGDATGLPLLAEYLAEPRADDWMYTLELVPRAHMADVAEVVVSGALVGGDLACSEKRMWLVIQRMRDCGFLDAETQANVDVRIFEHAAVAGTRRAAAKYAIVEAAGHDRLARVAEIFAWGVRRGVELTGRLFRFHMTATERELGHTKLDGSHIFVSPLPMLRGETHGKDVVEGLVLHELGHHIYHRSPEARELWRRAHGEGIGHFLNLIADEHLERNLRALDQAYGDRLKRLGAYAFQHAPQEIKVAALLDALGASTARALIPERRGESAAHHAATLEVAFDEDSVRVRRGAILGELDRAGHPVARFSRALRMGLGNRSGDPLVEQALALCGKELRALDMRGLYELTKRLVELFGGQHQIAKVFGGPEGLVFGERDDDVYGAGIDDDILQREVERILDPRRSKRDAGSGGPDRLQLNVNPDTKFDRITRIVRVRGDVDVHRQLAVAVQRHSTRLRAFLDELGLRWEPQRARTQGRGLDRTRLTALVTRNDPRMLVARTPVRRTDLFLGTLVDCSSSMIAGENIERAKKFAILVAEAVRTLPGVDARFFGFTDSTIYDAGSATECGVVGLTASGGNNDAAALFHAANAALNSKCRAKVLVMISDGLPTQCSIDALRSLVTELTRRRGMVCAQVAVRDLEEVCFPHYVVLDDREPDVAVAKFGRMIGELARRSLAS